MSRAGVNADVAERCLGHVIGGVRGIYDRHEYFEEKKRAFELLAGQIERIVNPQANVVPMGGEARWLRRKRRRSEFGLTPFGTMRSGGFSIPPQS